MKERDESEVENDNCSPEYEDDAEDFDVERVGEEEMPRKDALGSSAHLIKPNKNDKRSKSRSLRRRKAAPRISVNQSSISVAQARGHKGRPSTKTRNVERTTVPVRNRDSWFPSSEMGTLQDLNGSKSDLTDDKAATSLQLTRKHNSSVFEPADYTLE